jgi:hypothetical protein
MTDPSKTTVAVGITKPTSGLPVGAEIQIAVAKTAAS